MCPCMSSVYNREGVYGICTTVNIFYLKKNYYSKRICVISKPTK